MQPDEFLNQSIAQLSALPPRKRLEEFRAIQDLGLRRRVAKELPPEIYGEILAESGLENLNRNVRERLNARNHKAA